VKSLASDAFSENIIDLEKAFKVGVAIVKVEIPRLEGTRTVAIVINASTVESSDFIDDFITNVNPSKVTSPSLVDGDDARILDLRFWIFI